MTGNDPLKNKAFRAPGLLEKLAGAFLGASRPIDCVQIEVSSFCGARCIYCPHTVEARNWKSRHMADETFASLWPLLRSCSRAHLQGWGEPFLHPRFFDFAALALRAGCDVSTTTSGMKMDGELAQKIAASGMDAVAFSLVGVDEESNSARRGAPFDKLVQSVKTLRKTLDEARVENMELHFAYLMLADRMDAAKGLPELMDRLGVDAAVVSTLDYLAAPEHAELAFAPEEKEKINRAREILEQAALEAEASGKTIHFALPGPKPLAQEGGCRENIARSLYIDADGAVSPCVYLNIPGGREEKRRVFGHALQEGALQTFRGEGMKKFRQQLMADEPDPACLACPKRQEVPR